jgi:hypothetical protein
MVDHDFGLTNQVGLRHNDCLAQFASGDTSSLHIDLLPSGSCF